MLQKEVDICGPTGQVTPEYFVLRLHFVFNQIILQDVVWFLLCTNIPKIKKKQKQQKTNNPEIKTKRKRK